MQIPNKIMSLIRANTNSTLSKRSYEHILLEYVRRCDKNKESCQPEQSPQGLTSSLPVKRGKHISMKLQAIRVLKINILGTTITN